MANIIWQPQPKQAAFMERFEDEALYGGAAGGGKSEALVIEAVRQVNIPHYKALLLRKTFPELEELIDKSKKYYPRAFPGAKYNETNHTWTFPSGAKVLFGSMHRTGDKLKYQGRAYDFIGFDELTHFDENEYMYLMSRNRPNGPGTRVYMRATANPGGRGHGWVKERFITAAPATTTVWEKVKVVNPDGKVEMLNKSRIFIPATVFENEILMNNDPMYVARLADLPEADRNALLYGDWDSYSGQYFREWKDDPEHYKDHKWTHVIEPFDIPRDWIIYRSFDWGYYRPFSCGWWAVDYDGVIYRIMELYGSTGKANEGVGWPPNVVFDKIHEIENTHPMLSGRRITGVADPALWQKQTGYSIIDMAEKSGIYFKKADNNRMPGWQQVHYRLMFDDNGYARMYIFRNCRNFIRTIPLLQHSTGYAEDLDTEGEDHIADETRYMCMERTIEPRRPSAKDLYEKSPLYLYLEIKKGELAPMPIKKKLEVIKGTNDEAGSNQ